MTTSSEFYCVELWALEVMKEMYYGRCEQHHCTDFPKDENKWQCCWRILCFFRLEKGWRSRSHSRRQLSSIPKKPWVPERSRPARLALISKRSPALNGTIKGFYLQLSSIRMKSLMPRFSRKTPDEEVVLKRKEMSALSSPWNVGKWRYEVSLSKNAAFHTFSAKKSIESDEEIEKIRQRSAFVHSSIYDKAA